MSGSQPDAAAAASSPHEAAMLAKGAVADVPASGRTHRAEQQPDAGHEARQGRTGKQVAKDIFLFFAAPFLALAYLATFPFIGMAMLVHAWRHRKDAG